MDDEAGQPAGRRARGDTRERIQSVALELFAEHGYEKTSLREIAERLDVTKAALYYHFKSKEDIVRSFTEDYVSEVDALIAWGTARARTSENRALLLDHYSVIVGRRLSVLRFLEQNQAAVHHLMTEGQQDRKKLFRTQFETLRDLLAGPDAPLRDRVRASVAVVSVGISCLLFDKDASAPGELHDIVLETACELAGVEPPVVRERLAGGAAG
ncbi:MAG: TetR family transcriptional regulator [Actinomycetia bacterium]|nr:TetR family transcriptional regulator [Actinomycetes bacterium]